MKIPTLPLKETRAMRFLSILFTLLAVTGLRAERYGLLIAVGQYPHYAGITPLEAPAYDARSLETMLRSKWGFTSVQVLVDETATRDGILAAIRRLADSAKAGDVIFIQYSGHGTSAFDPNTKGFGMGLRTGAIIPYDIGKGLKPPYPAARVLEHLIVGERDLRPLFQQIDQKQAHAVIMFDSCFSGNAARAIKTMTPRSTPLPNLDLSGLDSQILAQARLQDSQQSDPNVWPYRNIVYFSAASRDEQAWEVGTLKIADGRQTFDRKPHGVFSDSILRGLDGAADQDHDGAITYRELHAFAKAEIQVRDGQHPLLHGPSEAMLSRSVFGQKAPRPSANPVNETPFRVKLAAGLGDLRGELARNPRITIVSGDFDLEVQQAGGRCQFLHSSGSLLSRNTIGCPQAAPVVQRLAIAHAITKLAVPQQGFNVALKLEPEGAGVHYLGSEVRFSMRAERDTYAVVLGLDAEGGVTVQAARQARGGLWLPLGASNVVEPVGVEFLKLVALSSPDEFLKWQAEAGSGRVVNPLRLEALLSMLRGSAVSQSQVALYTDRR